MSRTDVNRNMKEELGFRIAHINAVLEEYLPAGQEEGKKVIEAMNYSVLASGKRLRPMLIEETYRYFAKNTGEISGEEAQVLHPFMAAIEMIHTYSLVHDDLPEMDGDEYRRGKLTAWKKYGQAEAVLAGDGLLNYAYETAAKAWGSALLGSQNVILLPAILKAYEILTVKPGISGMVGGQAMDVENCDQPLSLQMLDTINHLKTGALIEASMMIGAALAGADTAALAKVEQSASLIGVAFQIQDDILDVTSTDSELGKPVGSDEKNHKTTYVTLLGTEQAAKEVAAFTEEAIRHIRSLEGENPFLIQLITYLINRKK